MLIGLDKACYTLKESIGSGSIGLVTNNSAVDSQATSAAHRLMACGLRIRRVYAPEHGFWVSHQAGMEVKGGFDEELGVEVISLYKGSGPPAWEGLEELDALIYDLPLIGVRAYTYTYILYSALKESLKQGVEFIVLDRPNPINGIIEGPISRIEQPPLSIPWIPFRYGLTAGELASYLSLKIGGDIEVIRMDGWSRGMWFDETGLPWAPPSPAIPSLQVATVYPGSVLIEATNLSEGRGTYSPFLQIGAPWLDNVRLANRLRERIKGAILRPVKFTPRYSKYAGITCNGVYIHVTDRLLFRPMLAFLLLIEEVMDMHEEFEWARYGGGNYYVDLLMPGADVRKKLSSKGAEGLVDEWAEELEEYVEEVREALMYEGMPHP